MSKANKSRKTYILEPGKLLPKSIFPDSAYASIGKEIQFDQNIFNTYCYEGWKTIHHDLLVVTAAIEFADRRWARGLQQWARHIHITIPVIEHANWLNEEVQYSLRAALRILTGDEWTFSFVKWEGAATNNSCQLPLLPNQKKEFVIAYSDGLDSRCVLGLLNENDIAISVRIGKNKQRKRKDEPPFDRFPFDVMVKPSSENSVRSRGFKFSAVTAIASHISGVRRIVVPESGQGALGPILLPLIKIYPDYRNHPVFFRLMENFIRTLLNFDVTYEQPRLWYTKGETVSDFISQPEIDLTQVSDTRSCWQQRFNVRVRGKLRQCGICAACLLRRMSLHSARVNEKDAYAINDLKQENFDNAVPNDSSFKMSHGLYDYGYTGARHLQQLSDMATSSEQVLKPYIFELSQAIDMPISDIQRRLQRLLKRHSEEWKAFKADQGENSFLNIWTKGGRYV